MTPEAVLERMIKLFGEDKLVNPEHYPKVFQHQISVAKWLLELETKSSEVVLQDEKIST